MTKSNPSLQKKKKKRVKRLRRVLLLLMLIALVICICLFTPFFRIKTVQVTGNESVAAEKIMQAADIPQDTNIFKLNKRAVRSGILKIPEIESVKIRRSLPSKVHLTVIETAPVMYFPYLTGCVVTNENGRVMALSDNTDAPDLLQITGLEIENAQLCEKIAVQDVVKFDIIVNTIDAFAQAGLLQDLRSCHFDNLTDFHVYLKDGTKVIFGKTTELDYKLSVLTNVLTRVNRTEGAYIDLTTPSKAVYGMLEQE